MNFSINIYSIILGTVILFSLLRITVTQNAYEPYSNIYVLNATNGLASKFLQASLRFETIHWMFSFMT